jgi:hypothetical protein
MKLKLLLLATLLFALATGAQSQTLTYSKAIYSDSSNGVGHFLELADGSLMSFGYSNDSGFSHMTCDKLDAQGRLLWSKRYGGGVYDIAIAAAKSATEEIYVAGDTRSFGANGRDAFLTKMDTAGNIVWTRMIGGPGDDGARALCVASNGDIVVTGAQVGLGMASNNVPFFRFDPSGNLLVRKMLGDLRNQSVYHIEEYSPNKFMLVGNHLTGGTNMDLLVMMVDGAGALIWAKTYDGGVWDRFLGANCVYDAPTGEIIVAFRPGGDGFNDSTNMGFVQIDSLGNFGFARRYVLGGYDRTASLIKTDSGFVIAGNSNSHVGKTTGYFMAVNDSGVPQRTWLAMSRFYSSVDHVMQSASGGYLMQGVVTVVDSLHGAAWIIKTDSSMTICNDSTVVTPWIDYPMTAAAPTFSILDTGFHASVALPQFQVVMRDTFLCHSCPPPLTHWGWSAQNLAVVWSNFSSGGITSYVWDFGDGSTSTLTQPAHNYAMAGSYIVCLTATNGCGSSTHCDTITLTCPLPSTGFTFLSNNLTTTFNNATAGATSYLWVFGDGTTDTTANPSHTYATYGSYAACLYATNACGTDTLCQVVDLLVSAQESLGKRIVLYPNPCHDRIYIHVEAGWDEFQVSVTDLLGQAVIRARGGVEASDLMLDLSSLPAGCWLLRFEGQDWIQTERVIKR